MLNLDCSRQDSCPLSQYTNGVEFGKITMQPLSLAGRKTVTVDPETIAKGIGKAAPPANGCNDYAVNVPISISGLGCSEPRRLVVVPVTSMIPIFGNCEYIVFMMYNLRRSVPGLRSPLGYKCGRGTNLQ
eukprot:1190154-Prorocentrum_minimum.AAC.6